MFRKVYLDHAATTPVDQRVVDAMLPYLTGRFGNASSIHSYGQEARAAVDAARHQVAALIDARPAEIVFTSGGTESNNLALKGVVDARDGGDKHIIVSDIEHPAVSSVCDQFEEWGADVTRLPAGSDGTVKAEDVDSAIRPETILISVMAANNEIGTIQPIEEIGSLVRARRESGHRIIFHTDAVQAVGKMPVSVKRLDCDLLSLSGHKIYAPKGVGALFIRRGARISAQSLGGHQERELRGGTENVAGIVAMGKACELAIEEGESNAAAIESLRRDLEERLLQQVSGVVINGRGGKRIPNISNISFEGIEGEGLLIHLDMAGIAVSTGSACSSGSVEPSPVILALGTREELARGSVRFSLGKDNSPEDIDYLMQILPKAVDNLRRLSPNYRSASGT